MKLFSKNRTDTQSQPRKRRIGAVSAQAMRKLSNVWQPTRSSACSDAPATDHDTWHDAVARLQISINDATPEQIQSEKARDQGQFLARQERWDDLLALVRNHDQSRAATATGTPLADLVLFGARADIVRAAEHALLHGRPAKGADFFAGIEAMEYLLADHPDSYPMALVVAHMHIDVGWAWRGPYKNEAIDDLNREAFDAHFERAAHILSPFDPERHQSPALAAARCALVPADNQPLTRLCAEFEALIALDPLNPRHMRSLGNYMLPRWYGDFDQLDLCARRVAAQTYDLWGAAGYTWVWFDALLVDPSGLQMLEVDYFIDGVRDALQRCNDQHTANLMAAHLYRSWQKAKRQYGVGGLREDLPPALRAGFEMVVHDHLREIHPLIWGHSDIGFENTARVISKERLSAKGCDIARQAIAMPFMHSLQAGHIVSFTPEGIIQLTP